MSEAAEPWPLSFDSSAFFFLPSFSSSPPLLLNVCLSPSSSAPSAGGGAGRGRRGGRPSVAARTAHLPPRPKISKIFFFSKKKGLDLNHSPTTQMQFAFFFVYHYVLLFMVVAISTKDADAVQSCVTIAAEMTKFLLKKQKSMKTILFCSLPF